MSSAITRSPLRQALCCYALLSSILVLRSVRQLDCLAQYYLEPPVWVFNVLID
jgi:hypothetical protein